MTPLLRLAFEALGLTPEAIKRGSMEIEIVTLAGDRRTVALKVPMSVSERNSLLVNYARTSDAGSLVRPMLDEKSARPEFFATISPASLVQLSNIATGLILGPEKMFKMIEGQLDGERIKGGNN